MSNTVIVVIGLVLSAVPIIFYANDVIEFVRQIAMFGDIDDFDIVGDDTQEGTNSGWGDI